MKKILTLIFCSLPIMTCFAQKITITCPQSKSIAFTEHPNAPMWRKYSARGDAVVSGDRTEAILMTAETNANTAQHFLSADLHPGDLPDINDFMCHYSGATPDNNPAIIVLAEYSWTPLLAHCRFKNGDPWNCDGTREQCQLTCKI